MASLLLIIRAKTRDTQKTHQLMKHGKKETGGREEEYFKNQENSFFLPGKKNVENEKRGPNTAGNGEKKKGNLSDVFFLSDYPWDEE